MADKFNAIENETYVFIEGDEPNQFFFYRKDGEVLGNIDHEPMDFYQAYIMQKMIYGEIEGMVATNILAELSTDGRCMRITAKEIAKGPVIQIDLNGAEESEKPLAQESWWQKAKRWLLGKKQ